MGAHLHVLTLAVKDFERAVRFYSDLGFERRFKATGDAIAFFDAGGLILSLFRWDMLAEDADVASQPRPQHSQTSSVTASAPTDPRSRTPPRRSSARRPTASGGR